MTVDLEPWGEDDLDLLRRINMPEMKGHLGGPETDEKILDRHRRYVHMPIIGTGMMFRVLLLPERVPVGSIGYWERDWQGEKIWETGWSVLTEYQGRGLATAGAYQVIRRAAATGRHRWLHAFPKIEHTASNAVCRKSGFTLLGECDFEYPKGTPIRCHDWTLDLEAV